MTYEKETINFRGFGLYGVYDIHKGCRTLFVPDWREGGTVLKRRFDRTDEVDEQGRPIYLAVLEEEE